MILLQHFTISLLVFSSLGVPFQEEEIPTATIYVAVLDDSSQGMQQLQRLIDQNRLDIARIQNELQQLENVEGIPDDIHLNDESRLTIISLTKELTELQEKFASSSQAVTRSKAVLEQGNQAIDALVWTLEQMGEFDETPDQPKAIAELQQLAQLKRSEAELLAQFGADHPNLSGVREKIAKLEEMVADTAKGKNEDGDDADREVTTSREKVQAYIKEKEAEKQATLKQLKVKEAEYNQLMRQFERAAKSVEETEVFQNVLNDKKKELSSLTKIKQDKIEASKSDFNLVAFANSPDFVRRFADKYKEAFKSDDLDALTVDLTERIVVEPDPLGQPYVYTVSFRHESELFSKAVLFLLAKEIERNIELNPTPDSQGIGNIQGLEQSLAETEGEIATLKTAADKENLQRALRKRELIQARIAHSRKSFEMGQRANARNLKFEFHVLQSGWALKSDKDQNEYRQMRQENPELPELTTSR